MNTKKKVKAKHAYQRQNEDELSFLKGDIITVTKKEDGGWWEGTLNGNTGWFPSNFVREIRNAKKNDPETVPTEDEVDSKTREMKLAYYQQVLQNILETERNYVKELQSLVGGYIKPLQPQTTPGGDGIPASDILVLSGNIQDIIDFQLKFVRELEECSKLPYPQQNAGQCFVKNGETFRTLYEEYCSNHPSAVTVIQTHKDQITRQIESKCGQNSGLTQLTAGLSKPFRHLEEYSSLLRELERHLEDSHSDKAYVLQAISQYERISLVCQETRKRKETIQHILSSPIQGLENDPITSHGPVLHMSAVIFLSSPEERKERYLLLFSHCLIMLSVSPRMSGFIYEGLLPLTALKVKRLDDTLTYQHAFEITGTLIDRKIVITRSTEEQRRWIQVLESQCDQCRKPSLTPTSHPSPIVQQVPVTQIPPTPKPLHGQMQKARTTPELHLSPTVSPPLLTMSKAGIKSDKNYHILSLRPSAPLRNLLSSRDGSSQDRSKSPKPARKNKRRAGNKPDRKTIGEEPVSMIGLDQRNAAESARLPDEQEVLEVLKHYCNAMHTRNTTLLGPGGRTRQPSILEEKIIIEDPENGGLVGEKSLVDTVYDLKDQVAELIKEQRKLHKRLEEESKSRKKLENLIKRAARATTEPAQKQEQPSSTSLRRSSSSSSRHDGAKESGAH